MIKELLVPKMANEITFHKFSSDSYFIHQKFYGYRIKISNDFYELIKKVDGKKNLAQLVTELNSLELDVDLLYDILYENLGSYGIVVNDKIKVEKLNKPSYLKLSFIVIPAKIIAKVTPYLNFLFVPKNFIVASALSLLIVGFGIFQNFEVITNQNLEEIWLQLLVFGFISVTFHEFGHATAAHYFGAEHGGIGGGFYLFSPVYFADVTDIWRLNPKKRIVVNLAGIYFELLICSVFVLAGFLFNFTYLSVVGLFIVLNTLFNLNPFLRSDGYWVLTDLLEIPNLYKKSSQVLKISLKSIWKGHKKTLTKREIFLSIYGSVNFIFIGIFIYYILILNPMSILYLPLNLYDFIYDVYNGKQDITVENLTDFILPFLFYYLVFKLIQVQVLKKTRNKRNDDFSKPM